jgi:hypothetical protein
MAALNGSLEPPGEDRNGPLPAGAGWGRLWVLGPQALPCYVASIAPPMGDRRGR